jgi:hypothetical protein
MNFHYDEKNTFKFGIFIFLKAQLKLAQWQKVSFFFDKSVIYDSHSIYLLQPISSQISERKIDDSLIDKRGVKLI